MITMAELEADLARLQAERESILAELPAAEAAVRATEQPLERARAAYAEAGRQRVAAERKHYGPTDAYGTYSPRSPKSEREAREDAAALEAALATWEQADRELHQRLVAYNAAGQRWSGLKMTLASLDMRISQAEAALETARSQQPGDHGWLQAVRARVTGGDAA